MEGIDPRDIVCLTVSLHLKGAEGQEPDGDEEEAESGEAVPYKGRDQGGHRAEDQEPDGDEPKDEDDKHEGK